MRTQELLTRPEVFDAHPSRAVSTRSMLADDVWDLDTDDPGHRAQGVRVYWWAHAELRGSPSESEAALLLSFKKLGWLALADSTIGVANKPAGLYNFGYDSCRFVRFMAAEGMKGLDEITPAFVEDYCRSVTDEYEASDGDGVDASTASYGTLARLLRVPWAVWKARHRLRRAGIAVPPSDPLSGNSPKDWATKAVVAADDRLVPIPPEVFLRIANAAAAMVTEHASDVLAAQQVWLDFVGDFDATRYQRVVIARRLADFGFETAGKSHLKWPAGLIDPDVEDFEDGASTNLVRLICSLRDACAVLVLATTGVRPCELIAIPGGWNDAEGLPACVRKERTPDGLMDVFLMRSKLTKGQIVPVAEEWVIGSAPVGANVQPLGVLALSVMERLLAPWRALADDPVAQRSMYVRLDTRGLPKKPSSIKRPMPLKLTISLRLFFKEWVDLDGLPDFSDDHARTPLTLFRELQGASVKPRQFRKNYGQFLLRTDSGLLPALRTQYKHASVTMLQYDYVGNSPALLTSIRDEHRHASVRAIANMLGQGPKATSGRLAEIISRHGFAADPSGRPAAAIDATEADRRGLVLIPGEHGSCGIRWAPHLSRCNQLAGKASFLNAMPSFAHRNPTVCSGCQLFTADRSHLPFWQRRHEQNARIWEEACAAGLQYDYRVAEARKRTAAAMIKVLEGGSG